MYEPEQTTGTTTVHVIGKCPIKGCRNRRRNTYPGQIKRNRLHTWTEWKLPAAAPYTAGVFAHLFKGSQWHHNPPSKMAAYHATGGGHPHDRAWLAAVTDAGWICTTHDRFMVTVEVKGTVNLDKTCDGRCTNATGPNCECPCGGANHGAAWQPVLAGGVD